jgi:hypothetical protein
MGSRSGRWLVVVFLVLIGLPLAVNVAGRDGADAAAENRELAPFPRLDGTVDSVASFGNRFGHWFEDHFGFRAALVRWYGESRLFGLGVSPTTAVINGRDGWFFYADDKAIEDYVSDDLMTPEEIANWREALVRARRWLSARHIGFVFLVAPDKHVIYADEMPTTIVRVSPISRTDQLYGSVQDTGFVVDVRPALLEAKARERIYQKTDTHWNDRGALVAYQAIVNAARAQVPAIGAPWTRADFRDETHDIDAGDLAGMMGLKRVLREEDLALVPLRPRRAQVVEPAGASPMAEEGRLVTEIPGSRLPRAVIFRDSFTSRLVPFLSEHFSRAVYLWQNDFDAQVVEQEHPDIVIQQIVGRHLLGFIPSPELVPAKYDSTIAR